MNPSNELLATLRYELDLDLRDAPDDSDDGGSRAGEAGPSKKCRPWHWLPEMKYVQCIRLQANGLSIHRTFQQCSVNFTALDDYSIWDRFADQFAKKVACASSNKLSDLLK